MKYAYCVFPLGLLGGSSQTIWTSTAPTADRAANFEIAEIYAAQFTQVSVELKFIPPSGGVYGLTYFTITRPGYEPLTIVVYLM